MKKIILTAALVAAAASSVAYAQTTACGGTAGKATVTATGAATDFIKTTFTTPCSNKVLLRWNQNATAAWVASGSTGGACWQIGHTDAGVKPMSPTCSPASPNWTTTPTAVDDAALTEASTLGSS